MVDGGAGGVRCSGRLCQNGLEARALAAVELVHVVLLVRVGRLGAHVLGGGHCRRAASEQWRANARSVQLCDARR